MAQLQQTHFVTFTEGNLSSSLAQRFLTTLISTPADVSWAPPPTRCRPAQGGSPLTCRRQPLLFMVGVKTHSMLQAAGLKRPAFSELFAWFLIALRHAMRKRPEPATRRARLICPFAAALRSGQAV